MPFAGASLRLPHVVRLVGRSNPFHPPPMTTRPIRSANAADLWVRSHPPRWRGGCGAAGVISPASSLEVMWPPLRVKRRRAMSVEVSS